MEYRTDGEMVIFRLDRGEEVMEQIHKICKKENIISGLVQGIGASNRVVLKYLNQNTKELLEKTVEEGCEISSFSGNITEMDGQTYLHCHIALARSDFSTISGHCHEAWIGATFEGILIPGTLKIDRKFSEEIGLNLLKF